MAWDISFLDTNLHIAISNYLVYPTRCSVYAVLYFFLIKSSYMDCSLCRDLQSNNDPNTKNTQAITQFLPLMIGYFALSVPSGLSLYWYVN